jgi:predicted nucleotidyltransferase
LADELEHILKLKIDLVSKKGLKERHLKSIEKELEYVSKRSTAFIGRYY